MSFLKGWLAEQQMNVTQKLTLDPDEYRRFSDVYLRVKTRYFHIDHIIVSRYGVFVIKATGRQGWIYGAPSARYWTQVSSGTKRLFLNPVRQNLLHSIRVAEVCGTGHEKVHSVVVFYGECRFADQMPENVVTASEYIGYIRSKQAVTLTDAEVAAIERRLRLAIGGLPLITSYRHSQAMRHQRRRKDTCPRCGAGLEVRAARVHDGAVQKLVGCEEYPRCNYAEEVRAR